MCGATRAIITIQKEEKATRIHGALTLCQALTEGETQYTPFHVCLLSDSYNSPARKNLYYLCVADEAARLERLR